MLRWSVPFANLQNLPLQSENRLSIWKTPKDNLVKHSMSMHSTPKSKWPPECFNFNSSSCYSLFKICWTWTEPVWTSLAKMWGHTLTLWLNFCFQSCWDLSTFQYFKDQKNNFLKNIFLIYCSHKNYVIAEPMWPSLTQNSFTVFIQLPSGPGVHTQVHKADIQHIQVISQTL